MPSKNETLKIIKIVVYKYIMMVYNSKCSKELQRGGDENEPRKDVSWMRKAKGWLSLNLPTLCSGKSNSYI